VRCSGLMIQLLPGVASLSLAWHSVLHTQCCRSCGADHRYSLDLIPGPGSPYATKKKKKKKRGKRRIEIFLCSQVHFLFPFSFVPHNLKLVPFFLSFVLLGPYPWHIEVSRLGVESEL